MSAITWIVRFLDGSEKTITEAKDLGPVVESKVFNIEYRYRPNIQILTEVAENAS